MLLHITHLLEKHVLFVYTIICKCFADQVWYNVIVKTYY